MEGPVTSERGGKGDGMDEGTQIVGEERKWSAGGPHGVGSICWETEGVQEEEGKIGDIKNSN